MTLKFTPDMFRNHDYSSLTAESVFLHNFADHLATTAQQIFDAWLEKQIPVWGNNKDMKLWRFQNMRGAYDTHTARICAIEEIPTNKPCDHEPIITYSPSNGENALAITIPRFIPECRMCGKPIRATGWTDASHPEAGNEE